MYYVCVVEGTSLYLSVVVVLITKTTSTKPSHADNILYYISDRLSKDLCIRFTATKLTTLYVYIIMYVFRISFGMLLFEYTYIIVSFLP